MSRRINLWPVDYEFLTTVLGSGDASIKSLLVKQYETDKNFEIQCEWDDALRIATNAIDHGFPNQNDSPENDCHFLAAQMLSLSCQLNRRSPDSEFHWHSFLETIDICFRGANSNVYDAFADGRPWFGAACPSETVYGIIRRSEVPLIVDALAIHRDRLGDDAQWMVDPQKTFFSFVAEQNSDVWYAA